MQGILPWVAGVLIPAVGYAPVLGGVAVATALSGLLLLAWVREPAPAPA